MLFLFSQLWYETDIHELKLIDQLCFDMPDSDSASLPRLMKCHAGGGSQDWRTSNRVSTTHDLSVTYDVIVIYSALSLNSIMLPGKIILTGTNHDLTGL